MHHNLQTLKSEVTAASFAVDAAYEKLRIAELWYMGAVEYPAQHSRLEDSKKAVRDAQREVDAANERFRQTERAYQTVIELPGRPHNFKHQIPRPRHERSGHIVTDC